jgi:hypothetical protein
MGWAVVTDGINPTRHPAQQAPCDAVPDGPSPHPQLYELCATDNAVLSFSKVPNATVQQTNRTLCTPGVHNVRLDSHGTDPGRPGRTGGALSGAEEAHKGGSSPPVPPLALIP